MPSPAIGVFLPNVIAPGDPLVDPAAAARHAEDLGLESLWAVDQLVAGTGVPLLDATVALAAAAGATTRLRLAFGVMIVPLHPTAWAAKQVASLQHVSGDRVILGVGVGGDRHDLSWAAAGAPRRERGRRTDAALAVLPDLIAGKPAALPDVPGAPVVRLAPPATVPPIVVGGMADAALARAAAHDGWFTMPVPPAAVAAGGERLAELASGLGRPTPPVTAGVMAALEGDPALAGPDGLARRLTDPDGAYGMPADAIPQLLVRGGPPAIAERLAELNDVGVTRVVFSLAGGDWYRQTELVAEAVTLLG
jgi:alkanesulfonate monooxygenase SsuD/methylene tetrahydromethanopterin reductase-like flavin-dependent oxidoreductase (luciferase family)